MNQNHTLTNRKILVVNDSPRLTALLASSFAAAGARITQAHCGKDGMQYIAWGGYDLIIVHLATPKAAELRIMSFINESRPDLLARTIVLADDALDAKTRTRLRACYSACLVAPFVPTDLVEYALRRLAFNEQRCAA